MPGSAPSDDALAVTQTIPRAGTLAALAATPGEDWLWYPGADREPLSVNIGGELTTSHGLVLHVQAGMNDPFAWFARASTKASSHWWVSVTGRVVQYLPANRASWAQGAGNPHWHSTETEGHPGEPLTTAQITALRDLYTWGSSRWGWPWRLAERPVDMGLGWHGMGGAAWGNHPGCPGELRRAQRILIISNGTVEDDMPGPTAWTAEDWKAFDGHVARRPPPVDASPTVHQPDAEHVAAAAYNKVGDLQTRVTAIAGALAAALPQHAPLLADALAPVPAAHPVDVAPPRPVDIALGAVAALGDPSSLAAIAAAASQRLADLYVTPTQGDAHVPS